MNRDHIAAELPNELAEWLHTHGSDGTWTALGRDLAVALGHRLLAGDPGTNPALVYVHRTADSQAIRHVANAILDGRHRWSAHRVARELIKYLELWGAQSYVERRLSNSDRLDPLLEADSAA